MSLVVQQRVYIIHPFKGRGLPGERSQNKAAIADIARWIINQGHCPVSPVHALSDFLDDTDPEQRRKAMGLCKVLLRGCDVAWAFGPLTHSSGCVEETIEAKEHGLIVHWYHAWPAQEPCLVLPEQVGHLMKERDLAIDRAERWHGLHTDAVATISQLQARLSRYEGETVEETRG